MGGKIVTNIAGDHEPIAFNVKSLLSAIPSDVLLVAAAKTRTLLEVEKAVKAGIKAIGQNYIQEASDIFPGLPEGVKKHFIGNLQSNKVNKAVELFDMIETVDSAKIALKLNSAAEQKNKFIDVLIEVNSGCEDNKSGVFLDEVRTLAKCIAELSHVNLKGLMTMGPFTYDQEEARPFFAKTKELFDVMKKDDLDGVVMEYLSMGMTDTYMVAIEEGANIVRIGTGIFGNRK
jgi:PLP dependent protein